MNDLPSIKQLKSRLQSIRLAFEGSLSEKQYHYIQSHENNAITKYNRSPNKTSKKTRLSSITNQTSVVISNKEPISETEPVQAIKSAFAQNSVDDQPKEMNTLADCGFSPHDGLDTSKFVTIDNSRRSFPENLCLKPIQVDSINVKGVSMHTKKLKNPIVISTLPSRVSLQPITPIQSPSFSNVAPDSVSIANEIGVANSEHDMHDLETQKLSDRSKRRVEENLKILDSPSLLSMSGILTVDYNSDIEDQLGSDSFLKVTDPQEPVVTAFNTDERDDAIEKYEDSLEL